jgi:hypothetical protein
MNATNETTSLTKCADCQCILTKKNKGGNGKCRKCAAKRFWSEKRKTKEAAKAKKESDFDTLFLTPADPEGASNQNTALTCNVCKKDIAKSHIKKDCICASCYVAKQKKKREDFALAQRGSYLSCRVCSQRIILSWIKTDCICKNCYQKERRQERHKTEKSKTNPAADRISGPDGFICNAIKVQVKERALNIFYDFRDGRIDYVDMIMNFSDLSDDIEEVTKKFPDFKLPRDAKERLIV